jgi:hypothetical protein
LPYHIPLPPDTVLPQTGIDSLQIGCTKLFVKTVVQKLALG